MGEFFMSLDKDPQQEDFLQGRMLGNPYSSNVPALGPLMRDVKNKICQGQCHGPPHMQGIPLKRSLVYILMCAIFSWAILNIYIYYYYYYTVFAVWV